MASTVRRSSDKGLSRLKRAMDNDQNPLSMAEVDFVQTGCRILGIDSAEMISVIGRKALEKGRRQVRKVMMAITAQLDELGARVEAHRRATLAFHQPVTSRIDQQPKVPHEIHS
jgi:hypothetical protein